MFFDADFSMGQVAHFMAWFVEEFKVFWAAFSGARFAAIGAMWIGVAGNGQEHFVNQRGDCSGFVFGSLCGIRELTQGIQAAFEGKAIEIGMVSEGGLLHDTADQVIGHKMHSQFAFDHVRGNGELGVRSLLLTNCQ